MDKRKELWEMLFQKLESCRLHKQEFCVRRDEDIFIMIHKMTREVSGCFGCKIDYECFEMEGTIRAKYLENATHRFTASISPYYMYCKDRNPDNSLEFCPIFKGFIEDTKFPICDYFLSEEDVVI